MYRLVEAHLALFGAYTVVMTADESVIRERWREGEMYNLDLVLKVNEWYRESEFAKMHDIHFHATPKKPFMDAVDERKLIDKYIERQHTIERMLHDAPLGKTRGLHGIR